MKNNKEVTQKQELQDDLDFDFEDDESTTPFQPEESFDIAEDEQEQEVEQPVEKQQLQETKQEAKQEKDRKSVV